MTLKRIDTLDTIRGIASAQVLFYHCFLTIPSIWTVYLNKNAHVNSFAKGLTYSPLHVLWGGHEAVILFFVLSGFVLYLPFLADRPLNYPSYFIKRFFRLYAPFAVTLIIAGIIRKMVVNSLPPHEFSAWFLDMWSKPLAPGEYFNFFLFQGRYHHIVTSLWSLPIEMKISVIFPFICKLFKSLSFHMSWIAIVLCFLIFKTGKDVFHADKYFPDFLLLYSLIFFIAGAFICKYHHVFTSKINDLHKIHFIVLLIVVLLIYTLSWSLQELGVKSSAVPSDYLTAAAAMILIVMALCQKSQKFLTSKILTFLGKISYSLYLIHPIILCITIYILHNYISLPVIILFVCCASVILAYGYYHLVEMPFMRLGRYLGNFLKSNTN